MRAVPVLVASLALLVAVGGGTGGASLPAGTTFSAAQGAENAAGVVIATPDGEVRTVCVRFSADAIDGRELLELAEQQRGDVDPVFARFGSQGSAVCALCGTGCPASDCFCQSAYWNYNVAREGRWVRAGRGVEGRTVGHGDVDGWAFGGDGAAPPYVSFERICGEAAEPSPAATSEPPAASPEPPPPAEPSPTAEPGPTAAATAEPSREPPTDAPTDAPSVASTDAPATPTPPAPSPAATAPGREAPAAGGSPSPRPAATPSPASALSEDAASGGGGGAGAAVAFLALLAGLVAATLRQRRRRQG